MSNCYGSQYTVNIMGQKEVNELREKLRVVLKENDNLKRQLKKQEERLYKIKKPVKPKCEVECEICGYSFSINDIILDGDGGVAICKECQLRDTICKGWR